MENSVIRSYLADIQRFPLLSAAEECDLSEKINASDESAYKKLVNCNLRLVVSVALRIAHKQIQFQKWTLFRKEAWVLW